MMGGVGWWRTRLLFLCIATRSSALSMSSASPPLPPIPGGHHSMASESPCDSSGAPNVKKLKIEQPSSFASKNEEKEISDTAGVPSSAIRCKATRMITLTPKFDFPSSAVKITGPSVTKTCGLSYSSTLLDTCNGEDSEQGNEHEQVVENSCSSMEVEPQEVQDNPCDSDLQCTFKGDITSTSKELEEVEDDQIEMEADESQDEAPTQVAVAEDEESTCGVWEQLPFFDFEEVEGCTQQLNTVDETGREESSKEACKRKRRRGKKVAKVSNDKPKTLRLPPNAFVAVRIPSLGIRDKLEEVQGALLAKDKSLEAVFVPAAKNHLTLVVMRLDHQVPEEIEKAKLALREATEKVVRDLDLLKDPLELKFSGLGNFSTNVLFAKITEDRNRERLIAMADIVKSVFVAREISSANDNSKKLIPHLTIAKMSKIFKTKWKNKKKQKKNKKKKDDTDKNVLRGIEPSAYAELIDTEFGSQTIDGLELLSMIMPPDKDGYYYCFDKCHFDDVLPVGSSERKDSQCEPLNS